MWNQLQEGIGYIGGAVNQGLIRSQSGAILIDTGLDKSAAKKLIRLLQELNLQLVAIINTHSHADHIGGNRTLLDHFGEQVKVFAPEFEETAIRHTIWEPVYLYGGAIPFPELQNKFLMAEPSPVHEVIQPGPLEVDGVPLEVIPLYGHAYRQVGIACHEVLFAADSFFGTDVLRKHPIPFQIDLEETFASFKRLEEAPFRFVVPGHGSALGSRGELHEAIAENRSVHEKVLEHIISLLDQPLSVDQMVSAICGELGIGISNTGGYLLYQTAIKSCLAYLLKQGRAVQEIADNRWIWRRA